MNIKNEIFFEKNSELGIEFSKYVLEHPEMDEILKNNKVVIFLPEYDIELKNFNIKMGKEIEAQGGKVLYIKVKKLANKISSRLIGVEVSGS